MIRILLVEDQPEKKRAILEALLEVDGVTLDCVTHADNVVDAKRHLTSFKFGLLILDLNVPVRSDQRPTLGAGLAILSAIKAGGRTIAPDYILGMTALDDEFVNASDEFSAALWKLIRYDVSDAKWRHALQAACKFLVSQHVAPYATDGATFHTDVGIFVALQEELEPYRALLADFAPKPVRHDPLRYFGGCVDAGGRRVSVALVAAPRMGLSAAAITTTKLIEAFRPKYLFTSGICAGVRDKVELGDLLVADPCYDWASGKVVEDALGSFKPAAYQWRIPETLRAAALSAGENTDLMREIYTSFAGSTRPAGLPRVHIDAFASGGSVVGDADGMREISRFHKNLVGIDMENFGVLSATEYASAPKPTALAVKGVCDFGDGDKNDRFHAYAAHASAAFVTKLIASIWAHD